MIRPLVRVKILPELFSSEFVGIEPICFDVSGDSLDSVNNFCASAVVDRKNGCEVVIVCGLSNVFSKLFLTGLREFGQSANGLQLNPLAGQIPGGIAEEFTEATHQSIHFILCSLPIRDGEHVHRDITNS